MSKDLEKENEELRNELSRYKELLQNEEIDPITGLYAKNIFFSKAKALLIENPKTKFVFIKANIDKFQLVNSFYGFDEGDRLLQYFAHRLKMFSLVVPKAVVGHLGADSFVVCCSDLPNKGILPLLEKSIHSIVDGFREDFKLSVSVGIYHIEDNYMDLSLIHSRAIVALKKSKEQYGEYYTIYNESMNEDSFQKYFVINEMQTAFHEKQFEVYLQPKCNLTSNKVIGAEALVRWIHPEKGIISPDNFIPILESNGYISKLDEYVWNRACQYIRTWIDTGLTPIPISVNVSRVDLHNPELINTLLDMIEKNGISIEYLHLEITESAYSEDPYQIIDTVNKLHELGFYIELDDFGTGYSSLNVLNAMKLDTLKLDMSFIKAQTEDKKSGDIINFIVRLAKQLKLAVVAEGIETSEQLAFLRGIGCEMGQGFYFSRALPKDDFDEYMRNHTYEIKTIEALDHKFLLDIDDIWFPNSKFNFIFNHFVGALALTEIRDGVGSLLRTNDEYIKLIGYTPDDNTIFSENMKNFVHPEDQIEFERVTKQLNMIGKSEKYTIRGRDFSKKNSYIWIKLHSKVVAAEKGTVITLTSLENVNEEYKAQEKLKRSTKKQKELETQLSIYKDVGGDGVFTGVFDNGFVLEYANEQFYKIHGITKTYAMKHKKTILLDILHPDNHEKVVKYMHKLLQTKATSFTFNLNTLTKSKQIIHLFARGHILYSGSHPKFEVVIQKLDESVQ